MVPPPRTPLRADRLRALNAPRRVVVELDAKGKPVALEGGLRSRIVEILEVWHITDEWWRTPICRRYVDVLLEGGRHTVLFEDITTGEWFEQTP
jgi:hypothetical protein